MLLQRSESNIAQKKSRDTFSASPSFKRSNLWEMNQLHFVKPLEELVTVELHRKQEAFPLDEHCKPTQRKSGLLHTSESLLKDTEDNNDLCSKFSFYFTKIVRLKWAAECWWWYQPDKLIVLLQSSQSFVFVVRYFIIFSLFFT